VPEALARRIASLPVLVAAPTSYGRGPHGSEHRKCGGNLLWRTESYFRLDRIAQAAPWHQGVGYFDRLALDRALDSIGEAERALPPPWRPTVQPAPQAVEPGWRGADGSRAHPARPFTRFPIRA